MLNICFLFEYIHSISHYVCSHHAVFRVW